MVKGYWSTKDLCERYRCSNRTIGRWMLREANPLLRPRLSAFGSKNLWAFEDIDEWERKVSK